MSNPTELPDLDKLEVFWTDAKNTRSLPCTDPEQVLALIALARLAQPEGEAPQAGRPPATGDEPHGYWRDGEWYGYHPDENAVEFEVGSTVELTPVWTHGQAATFNVVGSDDSDDVSLIPASPADAALCNWTETPAPAATLSPLCGDQHAESGKEVGVEIEPFPDLMVLADVPYAMNTPEDWEPEYRDNWQALQVAEANKRELRAYARRLRAALAAQQAAAPHELKSNSFVAQNPEEMAIKGQQAAAPGALDGWNAAAKALAERAAGHFRNKDFELQDECLQCASMLHDIKPARAATSAPGTPEAPKPPFPISDDEMAALRRFWECATDGEGYDVEKAMMQRLAEMGLVQRKSGAYYMATDFGLYVLGEYTIQRAAQLDGGQEGSESNG